MYNTVINELGKMRFVKGEGKRVYCVDKTVELLKIKLYTGTVTENGIFNLKEKGYKNA